LGLRQKDRLEKMNQILFFIECQTFQVLKTWKVYDEDIEIKILTFTDADPFYTTPSLIWLLPSCKL